jgi:hypothetical protein
VVPLYFDQLGHSEEDKGLDSDGLPVGLNLSSAKCVGTKLEQLKEVIRKHAT